MIRKHETAPRTLSLIVAIVAIPILLALNADRAPAGRGDPDRSFGGGDGRTQLEGEDTILLGAATQGDGKLVGVGELGRRAGRVRLLVARFNRDGSLDRSFNPAQGLPLLGGGTGGVFIGPVGTTASAVAVQGDGKIVVAGRRTPGGSGSGATGMLVLRLTRSGTPDRSFSRDGFATTLANRSGLANAVALRGGRIVVAGSARLRSQLDAYPRVAVARFRMNGSRDRGFGSGGARVLDFGRFSVANAVRVTGGGKILLAGSVRGDLQTTSLLAARLTGRGSVDRSFAKRGLFTRQYSRGAAFSSAYDLVRAWRGRIVLAGTAGDGSLGSVALAVALTPRGRPDRRFSGDGVTYLRAVKDRDTFNTTEEPYPGAQAIARTGAVVVLGGYFDQLGLKRPALWALKRNGRLDRRFGRSGRTITPVGNRNAELSDLAPAPRRALYATGQIRGIIDPPSGMAARYRGR